MTDHPVRETELRDDHAPWKRGLLMLFFLIAFGIAEMLLWIAAILQFLCILFGRGPNGRIAGFGASFAVWVGQVARYLSAASHALPYPFAAWPEAEAS